VPVPVNSGTVEETWPPGAAVLFFGSANLPTDTNYQGFYIRFPSKPELSCDIITHYYLPEGYEKSFVQLSGITSIATGDSYAIFETLEKCAP
jgi:hypothetical protein